MPYLEYLIVGRHKPTTETPNPKIYRMRIFANNEVVAKSRFWYFLRGLKRIKRANGEILALHQILERNTRRAKNYGIWLRYTSRTNTHNLYKEYRDVSRVGAVTQLYNDMAGRHRALYKSIQIMDVKEIEAKNCKRDTVKQFHNSKIRFPLPHRILRAPSKQFRTTFKARRPITHFG